MKNNDQEQIIFNFARQIFDLAYEMENLVLKDGECIFNIAIKEQKEFIQIIKQTPELNELADIEREQLKVKAWLNFKNEIIDIINDHMRRWMDERLNVGCNSN